MRNLALLPALALAAGIAPPSASASSAVTPDVHVVAQDSAWMDIARAVVSDDQMARSGEQMLSAIVEKLAADKDIAEMEAAYPGMLHAFAEALHPLMAKEAARISPLYRQDLANLYAANLSENEALEVARFLRTEQMTRFVAAAVKSNSMHAVARDSVAEQEISNESISSDLRAAGLAAALQVNGADLRFIQAFYATPAGKHFATLTARKIAIDQKWANDISPEAENEVEGVVIEAMIAHIAETDPESAEAFRKEMGKSHSN